MEAVAFNDADPFGGERAAEADAIGRHEPARRASDAATRVGSGATANHDDGSTSVPAERTRGGRHARGVQRRGPGGRRRRRRGGRGRAKRGSGARGLSAVRAGDARARARRPRPAPRRSAPPRRGRGWRDAARLKWRRGTPRARASRAALQAEAAGAARRAAAAKHAPGAASTAPAQSATTASAPGRAAPARRRRRRARRPPRRARPARRGRAAAPPRARPGPFRRSPSSPPPPPAPAPRPHQCAAAGTATARNTGPHARAPAAGGRTHIAKRVGTANNYSQFGCRSTARPATNYCTLVPLGASHGECNFIVHPPGARRGRARAGGAA